MARPVTYTKSLVAANAALFAASQTPVSGTPLTLTGVSADTQRRVVLTYGVEAAQRTLQIVGTSDTGAQIGETFIIPAGAGGSLVSNNDYRTITQALPAGGGWSAAMTLGTNTTGSTPWVLLDNLISIFNLNIAANLTGVATYNIEFAMTSPLAPVGLGIPGGTYAAPPPVVAYSPPANPDLQALTVTLPPTGWTQPAAAVRMTITAGTGTVAATFQQAGVRD